MKIEDVGVDKITLGGRFREDLGDVTELSESIKEYGVLQPIILDQDYQIIAGERRWMAAKQAGLEKVPCWIHGAKTELSKREIELTENLFRKDFTWAERAKGEKELYELKKEEDPKWTQEDHAEYLGTSRAASSRRLALSEAMEIIPELEDCETQDEAWKKLKSIEEEMITRSLMNKADDSLKQAQKWAKDHYKVGDALQGLKKVRKESVSFIEVDPPYAVKLEKRKDRNQDNKQMDKYNEIDEYDYPAFIGEVANECYRILKPNSFMVWWFGHSWYARVLKTLTDAGFIVSDIPAIWTKGQSGQTASPDTMFGSSYEPFFLVRKGQPKLHKPGHSNEFSHKPVPPQKKVHPTERPIELMLDILDTIIFPTSTICVPFLGSGVTLRAAYKLKSTGFGWDLDEMTKNRFVNQVFRDMEEGKDDD